MKKIEILPHDLSQEGGELTPTMKVKRNVVADKYAGEIDALYGSTGGDFVAAEACNAAEPPH